jgi:hypothetical protein
MRRYFKDLNVAGWIKWIIIIIGSVLTFIGTATESVDHSDVLTLRWFVPVAFIAPCLIIPLGSKLNGIFYNFQIAKPFWNENPYNVKNPLVFFDFCSVFFLLAGVSRLLSVWIYHHSLDFGGPLLLAAGLGVRTGISLSLKLSKETGRI